MSHQDTAVATAQPIGIEQFSANVRPESNYMESLFCATDVATEAVRLEAGRNAVEAPKVGKWKAAGWLAGVAAVLFAFGAGTAIYGSSGSESISLVALGLSACLMVAVPFPVLYFSSLPKKLGR